MTHGRTNATRHAAARVVSYLYFFAAKKFFRRPETTTPTRRNADATPQRRDGASACLKTVYAMRHGVVAFLYVSKIVAAASHKSADRFGTVTPTGAPTVAPSRRFRSDLDSRLGRPANPLNPLGKKPIF